MLEGREKGPLVPRFLSERAVRTALQALYVTTVGSSNNAELLLNHEPAKIETHMLAGNPLVRQCFFVARRWLLRFQEFASSGEIFSNQFLEPARCPARFLLGIRGLSPSTTQLTGLVLGKSRPFFDIHFKEKVSSITIAIPKVRTVLSLRCHSSIAENVQHKVYAIKRVQPVPFVNRIHPTSMQELGLELVAERLSLSELDFLNVSFSDVSGLCRSVALENFCEIWTRQMEKRRLGFPFIICGRVVSAGVGPCITLQSIQDPELTVDLYVTDQLLALMETDLYGLRNLEGKTVRALAVDWYRYGSSTNVPEYPEILALEHSDESELLMDDLIGLVRLREKVEMESLKTRYPMVDLRLLPPSITLEGGRLVSYYHRPEEGDAITDAFIKEKAFLKAFRCKLPASSSLSNVPNILVPARYALDMGKLRLAALGERVRSDDHLLRSLLCLICELDQEGQLPKTMKNLTRVITGMTPRISAEKLWWLRDVGFLLKTKEGARMTKQGLVVAYLATRQDLKRILGQVKEPVLSLLKLRRDTTLPTTLLLQAMYEFEREGAVKPLMTDGHRCELFWITRLGNEEESKARGLLLLQDLEKDVMAILGEVHHSLSEHKVLERAREKGIVLDLRMLHILLLELAAKGKIERSNDNWVYPWRDRILDLLRGDPSTPFTLDEILQRASIPPLSKAIVDHILDEMRQKCQATRILNDRWTVYPPDKEAILKSECKAIILRTLKAYGGTMPLEKMRFNKYLRGSIISMKTKLGFGIGSEDLIQQLLGEMVVEKRIAVHNGLVEMCR